MPTALRRIISACHRRGRDAGPRIAKTTLAAVVSFHIADLLHTSDQPILAPLTALLVVQVTLYGTLAHGLDRIASVVLGVVLAVGVASLTGLTWWSLGVVVGLSLIAGHLMRLGPFRLEVPISAMLVLGAAGVGQYPTNPFGAETMAIGRVVETLIGAAVGFVVNLLIAPPLHIKPADDAIGEVVGKLSEYCRRFAAELRGTDWSRAQADRYLEEARKLGTAVTRADGQLARAEESARLNPRGKAARLAQPRLRTALTGLEHTYVSLRNLARAVLDRTYFVPTDEQGSAYSVEARHALADVLDTLAEAVETIDPIATDEPSAVLSRSLAEDRLERLRELRDRLAGLLLVDPSVDPAAWGQHGALLSAVDRLRVEVASAVRPVNEAWQPDPVTGRQREAVRRFLRLVRV